MAAAGVSQQVLAKDRAMVQNLRLMRYAGRYAAAVALLLMCTAAHAQEAFDTPEDAVTALITAAKRR